MTYTNNIQALVVDIKVDVPQSTDQFLVDTNVWFIQAYNAATNSNNAPKQEIIDYYLDYLDMAQQQKAGLLNCVLSLSELAHLIEKIEFLIFKSRNPRSYLKQFRYGNPSERYKVVQEIRNAWDTITNMSKTIGVTINSSNTTNLYQNLLRQPLDGYDYFILDAMKQNNVDKIITNDGDFITVPNITVFTANEEALKAARRNNKLLTR